MRQVHILRGTKEGAAMPFSYMDLSYAQIAERIDTIKRQRNITILAHYYQRLDVQNLADFCGDSLELARKAMETDAEIIVFCGVMFMAETAKLLNPSKQVLIPEPQSGCPLAAAVTPEDLLRLKAENPDALVVVYVNTSAEVKAVADIVCTSANAARVVASINKTRPIIFAPDKNLCYYVRTQTNRDDIICWNGSCYVHDRFTLDQIIEAREKHPNAAILVHPECPPDIQSYADEILSTSGMIRYARSYPGKPIVLATEITMVEKMRATFPRTPCFPLSDHAICANMKLNTPQKLLRTLEQNYYEVHIPEEIAQPARNAIDRMLHLS